MWTLLAISIAGFFAQLIGGTIGMAFGVTATTGLLLVSFSPAMASSVVHLVEIGTAALNGGFHAKARNVDWKVALAVGIPGALGAFVGALLLSTINLSFSKPWIASVLLFLGVLILFRVANPLMAPTGKRPSSRLTIPIGLGSGFIDATAGGGWGIITTSTLVATNTMSPGRVVGTTSSARLLVALSGSLGFIIGLGFAAIRWDAVLAMLVGCLFAAPLAAVLVKKLSPRLIGMSVGVVVIVLNVRQLVVSLGAGTDVALIAMTLAMLGALSLVVFFTRFHSNQQS